MKNMRRGGDTDDSRERRGVRVTPQEAKDLATRTFAAIDRQGTDDFDRAYPSTHEQREADRERVASDLAGLRDCWWPDDEDLILWIAPQNRHHARRYADGLRRTAVLYGVTL